MLKPAAEFVHDLSLADVPAPVVERACLTILDCLGVMFSGAREPRVLAMTARLRAGGTTGRSTFASDRR